MNRARTTSLLLMLLMLSAGACAIGMSRLNAARLAAASARDDLAAVQRDLGSLAGTSGPLDVKRTIQLAATESQVEPVRNSDSSAAGPVSIRIARLTLEQMAAFVHAVEVKEPRLRADAIEVAALPKDGSAELWSANVTFQVRQ